jgi:hypothetical protein
MEHPAPGEFWLIMTEFKREIKPPFPRLAKLWLFFGYFGLAVQK